MNTIKTMHYVEKEYKVDDEWWFLSEYKKINERDIKLVLEDSNVVRFRFYDKVYYEEDTSLDGIVTNVSPWIYVGKRISYQSLRKEAVANEQAKNALSNMINKGFLEFVHKGFNQVSYNEELNIIIPIGNGDITLDEYIGKEKIGYARVKR